jgi:AraC-like DNA-binding protein
LPRPTPTATYPRRLSSTDRMMWVTPERVFYAGLLGAPVRHTKGSLTVCVAIEAPLHVRMDGGDWQTTEVAVIPPYAPCELRCEGRHVLALLIEPETVDLAQLPAMLHARGAVHAPELAERARSGHAWLLAHGGTADLQPDEWDRLFFGQRLKPRPLDARIATVLDTLKADPSAPCTAQACASEVGLSFSRFLHLFKQETGAPFRSVRTWKRARSLLHHVHSDDRLVSVALDIGYPDSTHFSHSIRQTYGLKPRDIFAGSRKLRIVGASAAA